MATITPTQAQFLGNVRGGPAILAGGSEHSQIKETASQTYAAGAPVYKDSNGTIAVATASSNIVGLLYGFAMKAATGTTGASVVVRPVKPGDRYIMNCVGTSTVITALTMLGDKTMFDLYTGNLLVANVDASFDDTKPWGRIVDLYAVTHGHADGDAVGDTNGRLIVEIGSGSGLQA
jgi:hypothetical protein